MFLKKIDLERILFGAALLGSGGGGKIATGLDFIEEIFSKVDSVELIQFPLPKAILGRISCIVCDIGSITAIDPKQIDAIKYAFVELSKYFKELGPISYVFPIETGPENTMVPFILAANLKIAVVDGDGAGRAVPTLPLCTFAAYGNIEHWKPICIANGKGDTMLVNSHKLDTYDTILRNVAGLKEFSKSASLALWPAKIEVLSERCVSGSITRCLQVGAFLEAIRHKKFGIIKEQIGFVNELEGYLIGKGKVIKKVESDTSAFNFSTIEVYNSQDKYKITIVSQNESLIAYNDLLCSPVALAPDSICYLTENFNPLTNAEISENEMVLIICVKAHEKLSNKKILNRFQQIIQMLGYSGSFDIDKPDFMNLGDLLLKLTENGTSISQ